MSYDHQKKAGNRGDIIKHVALVAALEPLLGEMKQEEVHYADTFAGYAFNPLMPGNQWEDGIGRFRTLSDKSTETNIHFDLWAKLCFMKKENSPSKFYAGSSLLVSNLCQLKHRKVRLSLWDTSPLVVEDLKLAFTSVSSTIRQESAKPADLDNVDFALIDPPGLQGRRAPDFPDWRKDIFPFLLSTKIRALLVWIPVMAATSEEEAKLTTSCVLDSLAADCKVTKVLWETRGLGMIGCQLIYRLPSLLSRKALQRAVDFVVGHPNWGSIVEPAQRVVHY